MPNFESGRRLCVLVEAGAVRYAIEATSVVEVAPPDSDGESIRGFLELKDLCELLGGPKEATRPGLAVVLDVSPTLAIRIKRVVEVADVARAQFFMLPKGLGETSSLLIRGCLLYNDALYLELIAEALPHTVGTVISAPMRPLYVQEAVPDRALIIESAQQLYGIPLSLVSSVTKAGSAYCPLPGRGGPVAGLLPQNQVLWPVYSFPGLLGAPAQRSEFIVLTELAGQNVGIAADRVLGVHHNFVAGQERGSFRGSGMNTAALFLDLERMFS